MRHNLSVIALNFSAIVFASCALLCASPALAQKKPASPQNKDPKKIEEKNKTENAFKWINQFGFGSETVALRGPVTKPVGNAYTAYDADSGFRVAYERIGLKPNGWQINFGGDWVFVAGQAIPTTAENQPKADRFDVRKLRSGIARHFRTKPDHKNRWGLQLGLELTHTQVSAENIGCANTRTATTTSCQTHEFRTIKQNYTETALYPDIALYHLAKGKYRYYAHWRGHQAEIGYAWQQGKHRVTLFVSRNIYIDASAHPTQGIEAETRTIGARVTF